MFRYELAPYTKDSKLDCPVCGSRKAFRRYIDLQTGDYLPEDVGMCDRVEKCGYKYTAGDWAKDNGNKDLTITKAKIHPTLKKAKSGYDTIPKQELLDTLNTSELDELSQYLYHYFRDVTGRVTEVLKDYKVGSVKIWNRNATIFWQISQKDIRTGKIMAYEIKDGDIHRVKMYLPDKDDPSRMVSINLMNWYHSLYYDNFNLKQCFFGEHLLTKYPEKDVHIVESEKTTVICSIILPRYLWLGSGSMNGLSKEKLSVLKGKKIRLFPDKGYKAFNYWKEKAEEFQKLGFDIECNPYCENRMKDFPDGADVGDKMLKEYVVSV